VAREFGTWQTRCGDVVDDHASEGAAIAAAIKQAQDFGRQGRFAAVVMRTLTGVYGPTGLIRTLPTRGRPNLQPQEASAEDVQILAEPAPSVAPIVLESPAVLDEERRFNRAPPAAGEIHVIPDILEAPVEAAPERPGRFMRVVAALAREAEERASAGRSFHQTISRLARSRRIPSLR
jgi:hypothetical protein